MTKDERAEKERAEIIEQLKNLSVHISDMNGKFETMGAEFGGKFETMNTDMNGKFNVQHTTLIHIKEEIGHVKEQVTTANGRTGKLEEAVNTLKMDGIQHHIKCPNTNEIKEIDKKVINLEKMEVGRKAVVAFTWKQLVGSGIITAIVFTILEFIFK